jgi:hypothetical protein
MPEELVEETPVIAYPFTDKIVAFEQDELDREEVLELFAELVTSGLAWQLQGIYGRTAAALIQSGQIVVDEHGTATVTGEEEG